MARKTKNPNLKLVERTEEDEMRYRLRQLSPEALRRFAKEVTAIVIKYNAERKPLKNLVSGARIICRG